MWLPTSVYERLPLFWLMVGLLFISAALYMSFEYALSVYYFLLGVICSASGIGLFMLRQHFRKGRVSSHSDHDDHLGSVSH